MTSPSPNPGYSHLELSIGAVVDRLCDDFENAWRQGKRPRIEEFLADAPAEERTRVLRELLALELEYRRKRGESRDEDEYRRRFPDHRELVDELLDAQPKAVNPHEASTTEFPPPGNRTEGVGAAIATSTRYTDLNFHDQGGLGEVFLADDEQLGRKVAVKFIHEEFQSDKDLQRRFLIEAEVTGRLDHPGIVPVYGIGEGWDGRPFYVMRFIEGDTLDTAIAEYHSHDFSREKASARRMALNRLLRSLIAACQTVAYAHNRGVLHRDIKPAHVVFGKYGETLVLDWGLALFFQRDARARASGEKTLLPDRVNRSDSEIGAGTIGYMSPEQLPDSTEPIGPGVDIYSFGATLYKILTGRPPIRENPPGWQERLREGDFPRPREINAHTPAALEAICLKALASRPALRYCTLSDFADDLERFMADESVSVYREPPAERFVRSARRHRLWTVAGLATLIFVAIGGIFASVVLKQRALEQESYAARQSMLLDRAEKTSLENLRLSAGFVAELLGSRIEQRFRRLELLAEDPALIQLVVAAEDNPPKSKETADPKLAEWLTRVSKPSLQAGETSSWFIMDAKGNQLARNPSKDTIGDNFAHRSYFHGRGRDLAKKSPEAAEAAPIAESTVSAVYEGTPSDKESTDPEAKAGQDSDSRYKIAFSVPIVVDEKVIGVLAMSVIWDNLLACTAVPGKTRIQLTDLRPDSLEETEQNGLVLEHPMLEEARTVHLLKHHNPFVREVEDVVKRYQDLRERRMEICDRLKKQTRRYQGLDDIECVPRDSVAAMTDADADYRGAYEPVFYRGRNGRLVDLGWIITVYSKGLADKGQPVAASLQNAD